MKHILLSFLICPFFFIACSSNDEDCNVAEPEETRYYVRYELKTKAQYTNQSSTLRIATEKGIEEQRFHGGNSWEATYGPVKKGFKTSISCSMSGGDSRWTNIHARIYVSREKEPFVLKAEGNDGADLSLSYTIDF